MKRNKLGLSLLAVGAAGFLASLTAGEVNYIPSELLSQNTEFLVSLPGTTLGSSVQEIKKMQNDFYQELNHTIGRDNYTVLDTFDHINVVKIKANEGYQDLIASINGVRTVAKNQTYRFSEVSSAAQTETQKEEGYEVYADAAQDATEASLEDQNTSAVSMKVDQIENNAGGAGSFVAILDSGFYLEHNYYANFEAGTARDMANARFNYDKLLEVEPELNAEATKTLSGVTPEYQSTDRADGSLYWNLKIPFYYDYGASSESSTNDPDVLSLWSNHGNHVASITGANGTYDGIAPNAQLALMKVFYESIPKDRTSMGGVYAMDEDILEALEDCVVLGIDALNMSLGTDLDDFTNKSAGMDVIDKLEADGINCNIAAGNAGKTMFSSMGLYKDWSTDMVDTGILGSYSNSTSANIIASSTNPTQYYETGLQYSYSDETGTHKSIFAYSDQVDYTNGADGVTQDKEKLLYEEVYKALGGDFSKLQLVTPGTGAQTSGNIYGTDADYSQVEAQKGNDYFRNKIAVVDRGSNSFVDKANAAQDHGCAALIVINNDPTAYEFNFGMSWASGDTSQSYQIPEIPVVFVLFRDRETIMGSMNEVKGDNDQNLCYESPLGAYSIIKDEEAENPNANELSDFSSEGATSRLDLTPTITAPGTSIRGATLGEATAQGNVPEEDLDEDAVGYLSGTSMATPNYTGISAIQVGQKQQEIWEKEHRLMTEEERIAFLKTSILRTMSTADQYEYENQIIEGVTPEDAVTDDDYHTPVTIYKPINGEVDKAPYSPRKQGAGVVNAKDAVETEVYLEGLIPDEKTGDYPTDLGSADGNRFAKVELRNNAKVASGNISLGVRFHNEGTTTKKYRVKLKVMATLINKYHNHDNELANYVAADAKYEGADLQTAYDTVLEEVTLDEELTVAPGDSEQVFNHTITEESKAYLSRFQNGTWLEGYIVFEDLSSENKIDLSMPYMGFYGDYAQADATEPFEFEKEERYNIEEGKTDGRLYGSDLINYLGEHSYSRTFINTSSMITGDSYDNYNSMNRRAGIQTNSTNPSDFGNELVYTKDGDNVTLYVGSDTTDVLYIQEFVYRSLQSERVDIVDEGGKKVITSYVTDVITNTRTLYKSHVSSSYISDYSLAHRGLVELPLYTTTGEKIPDGEYTIRFTYNLVYGSTQVKEFKLVVDSKAPALTSKSVYKDANGNEYLRLKFNELYIPNNDDIVINAGAIANYKVVKTSDGYLVDIPLAGVSGDKIFVNISDSTSNTSLIAININDIRRGLVIESDSLTFGSTYSYTKVDEGTANNISERYTVSIKDYTGAEVNAEYTAYLSFDKRVNSSVRVYGIDSQGKRVQISATLVDNTTIKFTTTYKEFVVEDNGKPQNSISTSDNATVSFEGTVTGGQVYVDKVSGIAGEVSTIYAIPENGYRVESVTVNGKTIAPDLQGNYQFVLETGVNTVVVTFAQN